MFLEILPNLASTQELTPQVEKGAEHKYPSSRSRARIEEEEKGNFSEHDAISLKNGI